MVDINPILERLGTYPAEALYAKKSALLARGLEVFDFSVGDPIEPTDPTIVRSFCEGVPEVSQYPSVAGLPALREACASWYERRFGLRLDATREILPSAGSKEAIFHLPLAFLDPRGERSLVLYGTPAYPAYERGTLFAGGQPWPVELRPEKGYRLEPWELDPGRIARTAIIWINYPHNPTSVEVDHAYLREISAFARERDILLCSDECYVDLYFEDPPVSLLEVQRAGVLVFHSLSKRSGMTGYRSGFIAGEAELIAVLRKMRGNLGTASQVMVQRAAIAAWLDDGHVEARRRTFRRKRDLFLEFFARNGFEHLPCSSTLYLWVRVPGGRDAVAYCEELATRGILVSPAPYLGADQPWFRIALVPSIADCQRCIRLWEDMLESP